MSTCFETLYIGIDNGVSGSIGAVTETGKCLLFAPVPTRSELNYTKQKRNITRVDGRKLAETFRGLRDINESANFRVFIERPMVNPGRFQATVSAVRALEAVLITVERLRWAVQYVDSKEWQKQVLPEGSSGDTLKRDSLLVGCRRFPEQKKTITKHKDADGLLIAEAMRILQR